MRDCNFFSFSFKEPFECFSFLFFLPVSALVNRIFFCTYVEKEACFVWMVYLKSKISIAFFLLQVLVIIFFDSEVQKYRLLIKLRPRSMRSTLFGASKFNYFKKCNYRFPHSLSIIDILWITIDFTIYKQITSKRTLHR